MKRNIKLLIWVIFDIILALVVRYLFEVGYMGLQEYFEWTIPFRVISRTFLTFLVVIIWIAIVIRSEYINSKLPWLIVLTLEPFIGLALFTTFGRSYIHASRYKRKPLSHPGQYLHQEPTPNFNSKPYLQIDSEITDIYKAAYNSTKHHAYLNTNHVTVLKDGKHQFNTLIHLLQEAQSFILMQYYIIKTDKTGIEIMNILKQKAENNVDVYLLYDAIGSVFLDKNYIKSLTASGVKVIRNEPVFFGFFNTKVNYRNHRKITVIDGKYGITGGMNLADEYRNYTSPFGYFRDTNILIQGDAVKSLTQLFFRDWYYNTKDLIQDEHYFVTYPVQQEGLVQIVPSGPEYKNPPIRNMYVKMINNAKNSIKIMTPYIALDQELKTSLIIASKSGVKIDIIIPGIPDKKMVYLVTKSFIDELIEEDINVYFYDKGFTHAKIFIIDDHLASCGTYNLDNRSGRINFELTALLYNTGVKELVQDFEQDKRESSLVQKEVWMKRGLFTHLIEGLFNLFSPLV